MAAALAQRVTGEKVEVEDVDLMRVAAAGAVAGCGGLPSRAVRIDRKGAILSAS